MEYVENAEVLVTAYSHVSELYYQDPNFGFYFLRLATGRLFHNLQRLECRLAGRDLSPALAPSS